MKPSTLVLVIVLFNTGVNPVYAKRGKDSDQKAFSGGWAGVVVGMDVTELPDEDGTDIMHGVQLGYNWDKGDWVLGVEAEIGASNSRKTHTGYMVQGDMIHVEYGRDLYAGIRTGRKLGNHVMFYGKAGYANSHLEYSYDGPKEYAEEWGRPGVLHGFSVGGGLEYQTPSKIFVKSEYRYSNFHDGLYRHQGVVGFGIHF